jgi:hypothetical protein
MITMSLNIDCFSAKKISSADRIEENFFFLPALGPSALSSILGSSRDALRRAVIHRGSFTPALQRPPRLSVHGECSLRLLCEFFRRLRIQNVPVPTRPPLHWPPLVTVHREKLGLQLLLHRVKERGCRFHLLAHLQRHNLHHVCDRCSRLLDRIRQANHLKRPTYLLLQQSRVSLCKVMAGYSVGTGSDRVYILSDDQHMRNIKDLTSLVQSGQAR